MYDQDEVHCNHNELFLFLYFLLNDQDLLRLHTYHLKLFLYEVALIFDYRGILNMKIFGFSPLIALISLTDANFNHICCSQDGAYERTCGCSQEYFPCRGGWQAPGENQTLLQSYCQVPNSYDEAWYVLKLPLLLLTKIYALVMFLGS